MKRLLLVIGFLVALASPLAAQGVPLGTFDPAPRAYTVREGDTLWELSGDYLNDPRKWGRLIQENPFLQESGRLFERDGKTIVLIRPGEELEGLWELGMSVVPLPIEQLTLDPAVVAKSTDDMSIPSPWGFWMWFLLIAGGLALLIMLSRFLRVFRDPATSGVPVVEGGVRPDQPREIEARFAEMVAQQYPNVPRPERIGPIEEGYLSGFGRVRYGDSREETRRLNREPAYRARFRFADGEEEALYFLARCANDVYAGTRYIGFTFESGREVVPPPAPPEPEVEPATHPASAIHAIREAAIREGLTVLEVGDQMVTLPPGSTIRAIGKEIGVLFPSGDHIAIRPARRKIVRAAATPASVAGQ